MSIYPRTGVSNNDKLAGVIGLVWLATSASGASLALVYDGGVAADGAGRRTA